MKRNILIVSPHSDDAELGCGGFIVRELEAGNNVCILLILLKNELHLHSGMVAWETRYEEFKSSMSILGAEFDVMISGEEDEFDLCTQPKSHLIRYLDDAITKTQADTVMMPVPSFHQEHQYVFECCMAATRPTKHNTTISRVLAYEYPAANWGESSAFDASRGGYYAKINVRQFERKMAALKEHKSQLCRAEHSLISLEGVETLARMRGLEAGTEYAEMFYVFRLVD